MRMQRQGDLLIVEVDMIPESAKPVDHQVLAEGEATGHFHRLNLGQVYEQEGTLFFRIDSAHVATLSHEEHGTVEFPGGNYKVIRQREYQPKGLRPRRVRD